MILLPNYLKNTSNLTLLLDLSKNYLEESELVKYLILAENFRLISLTHKKTKQDSSCQADISISEIDKNDENITKPRTFETDKNPPRENENLKNNENQVLEEPVTFDEEKFTKKFIEIEINEFEIINKLALAKRIDETIEFKLVKLNSEEFKKKFKANVIYINKFNII